jgi:DNA adenine methylase
MFSLNAYYEPFVGGGALLFYLQPKKFVINDINKELINAYKVMKNNYKKLREYLILMEYAHSEEFYLKIRKIDRNKKHDRDLNMKDSKELRAARFIYLNKAGFNGLYRVNSNGYFNVPSGKKEKVKTHEYPNLVNISKYFKKSNSKIKNINYIDAIKTIKKGDFVYFDPPYDYEIGVNGFDAYEKNGFGIKGQKDLAKLCNCLNKKNINFMVSNHNTKLIQKLYNKFNIKIIKVNRLIGGKGSERKPVEEVIITNYE